MPVSGFVNLPVVHGIIIPVTAFIDDTRSTVYTVDGGVVHLKTINEVADDGANAVVTGVTPNELVIKNVNSTTVGNGDRVDTSPSPSPGPSSSP